MKNMRTGLVKSSIRTRKIVWMERTGEDTFKVELETITGPFRSDVEVLVEDVNLAGAHFYYVQKIMVLTSEGFLMERCDASA